MQNRQSPPNHHNCRILFTIPELTHGGSRRSLENLLRLKALPDGWIANVVSLEWPTARMPYYETFLPYLVKLSLWYRICVQFTPLRKLLNALHNFLHLDPWGKIYSREAKRLQRKYHFDVVVGYEESVATVFASKFNTYRIAWMHCDYNLYRTYSNNRDEHSLYSLFDRIVCVSEATRRAFSDNFPECTDRLGVLYNSIDTGHIVRMASVAIGDGAFKTDCFTILSVGRMVEVKQYHLIPSFAARMLTLVPSLRFRWYIIGDGDEHYIEDIRSEIKRLQVAEYVVLLGARDNPYPYIAHSDLVVCTSRSESFSYTLVEAMTLHVPVVSIECPSTKEVVPSDKGIITDANALLRHLVSLVEDTDGIYTRLKHNIQSYAYDNNRVIRSVRELLLNENSDDSASSFNCAGGELVSIVVPVYNVVGYLPRCMETLLAQTYNNLEIILVDDGSTDGSGEMCDAFAAQDHRCRVIHQTNSGLWAARNAGKRAATGRYLSFVDSDDYVHREMIASLVAAINAGSGYDIAVMDRRETMKLNEDVTQTTDNVQYSELCQKDLIEGMLGTEDRAFYVYAWNKLYRTDLVQDIYSGPYWTSQDFDFNWQVYKRVTRAVWVHRPLYYYVQRQGSQVNNPRSMEMYLKCRTEILYHRIMELTPEMSCYRHSLLRNLYDFIDRLIRDRWHTAERDEWCAKCRKYERDARWIYWRDSAFPLRKKLFSTLTIVLTRWPHVLRWLYNVKRRNNNPFA